MFCLKTFTRESVCHLAHIPGDHTDPEFRGLVLHVGVNQDNSLRSIWRLRFQINGRRFCRNIGIYPKHQIEEARERAELCRKLLQDCFDVKGPYACEIQYQVQPKTMSFLWKQWAEEESVIGTSFSRKPYLDTLGRGKIIYFLFWGRFFLTK